MNEDDLRKLLQRTASDPGPGDAWSSFIETAHRRRKLRLAAGSGAVAMVLIVALAVVVVAGRDPSGERPKPSNSQEATPDEKRTTEVRRGDRVIEDNEDAIEEALGPISDGGRRGRGGTPGRPDRADEETSPRKEPRETDDEPPAPPDPGPAAAATCRGEPATVTGTPGRDRLRGTPGADVIAAGGGNDVVDGAGGDDLVCGGGGADNLTGGSGDDNLAGGSGDDFVDGGPGFDFLSFPNSPVPVEIQLLEGTVEGEGEDAVKAVEGAVGTRFDDVMYADHGDNVFIGEGGADFISMQRGDDVVYPGAGSDFASGSRGRDTLAFVASAWSPGSRGVEIDLPRGRVIGEGDDRISLIENATGTWGDDVFNGGERMNVFRGLAGNDTALGAVSDDALFGGPGDDKLDGGMGNDVLNGGDGTDTCLNGESGGECEAGTTFGSILILAFFADRLRTRRRRSR